eukprot:s3250_g6.t4
MVEMLRILVEAKERIGMIVYCNKNRHRSVGVSWLLASAYAVVPKGNVVVSNAWHVQRRMILVEAKERIGMIVYCNKNRHRSVGVSWLLASAYAAVPKDEAKVAHANAAMSWCLIALVPIEHRLYRPCQRQRISRLQRLPLLPADLRPSRPLHLPRQEGQKDLLLQNRNEHRQNPKRLQHHRHRRLAVSESERGRLSFWGRDPPRREAPGSARDRRHPVYPMPGYASSRKRSTSTELQADVPELLETMKSMNAQLDQLQREKAEEQRWGYGRRRRRSRSHGRGRRRRSRTRSDSRDSRRRRSRRPRSPRTPPTAPRAELRGRPVLPRPPSVPPPDRSRSESERWGGDWQRPYTWTETWNRRVAVTKIPVELLDEIYDAENTGWRYKDRALRWVGPYFPGSDPANREQRNLEIANHENNIKIVILGDTDPNRQFHTTLMKADLFWTVTTYDYVGGQWALTGARDCCTEVPEWNQASQSRILIFAPENALDEAAGRTPGGSPGGPGDDVPGDPGDGRAGDGDGHGDDLGDGPKDDEHVIDPPDEQPLDETQETHDGPEAGRNTEYHEEVGSAMIGIELSHEVAKTPEVKNPEIENPEVESPFSWGTERQISDDSLVGPFQLSNDVGDHSACVADFIHDVAQDHFKQHLTSPPEGQYISLSPSPCSPENDVVVEHHGPPVLEAMYSVESGVTSCTMNKGEKHAFVAGLTIMNEQDKVLTALVSQAPLDSRHMIVLKDCHMPWKTHDGVETLDIQEDWTKTGLTTHDRFERLSHALEDPRWS